MDEKTIEELKRRGHKVAGDGLSPHPEVDALLEKDRKAKK
jgi:hypothetical protein